MKVTVIGMIYKSIQYLDFMIEQFNKYRPSPYLSDYICDLLIIANDASQEILDRLDEIGVDYIDYKDPIPSDYYLDRVYRAWNYAGQNVDSDIFIFINSDMGFSPKWIENLIRNLNENTIPCSRLVESGKLVSGDHAISKNFGKSPQEYKEEEFIKFIKELSYPGTAEGGLFMPCAFYKDDFLESGGYPEGNVGKESGDHYFFYKNPIMEKKQHITVYNSLVYHIQEGELDD